MSPNTQRDELLERYAQAKARHPDGLPSEPPSALHERIMISAREQVDATNFIAPRADYMPASSPKSLKNHTQEDHQPQEAANDSFWSIQAFASIAVMGLSALIWWQFEQGTPQEQEAAKTASTTASSPAVVAIAPSTAPATASPATTAPAISAPASVAPSVASAESARSERNVIAPSSKPLPAPLDQQAAKPAISAAPPVAAQRSSTQEMTAKSPGTAASPTATAETSITADSTERSAVAKSTPPTSASKQFNAEAPSTLSAPNAAPSTAAPPPIIAPAARAAAAPMAAARPALLIALQERDAAALRQALAQGASPHLRTPDGNPVLTQAVIQRWHEGVRILLAAGAHKEAKNSKGHTAADVALELGYGDMTELLATPR